MKIKEITDILKGCRVGIAGAGGLGSNCAAALIRSGLGRLVIADFDFVDLSNLNRQFYFSDQIGLPKVEALKSNLVRINPMADIEVHHLKLERGSIIRLFQNVDLLIEAFDQADEKVMLIETAISTWPERPVITGLGMAGTGLSNSIRLRISDNIYICGDEMSEISDDNPPIAPRVGMVASMQANVATHLLISRYLHKKTEP